MLRRRYCVALCPRKTDNAWSRPSKIYEQVRPVARWLGCIMRLLCRRGSKVELRPLLLYIRASVGTMLPTLLSSRVWVLLCVVGACLLFPSRSAEQRLEAGAAAPFVCKFGPALRLIVQQVQNLRKSTSLYTGSPMLNTSAQSAADAACVDRMYWRAGAVHHDPHYHPAKQLH